MITNGTRKNLANALSEVILSTQSEIFNRVIPDNVTGQMLKDKIFGKGLLADISITPSILVGELGQRFSIPINLPTHNATNSLCELLVYPKPNYRIRLPIRQPTYPVFPTVLSPVSWAPGYRAKHETIRIANEQVERDPIIKHVANVFGDVVGPTVLWELEKFQEHVVLNVKMLAEFSYYVPTVKSVAGLYNRLPQLLTLIPSQAPDTPVRWTRQTPEPSDQLKSWLSTLAVQHAAIKGSKT